MGQEVGEQTGVYVHEIDISKIFPVPEGERHVYADIVFSDRQTTAVILIGSCGSILPTLVALQDETSLGGQSAYISRFQDHLSRFIEDGRSSDGVEYDLNEALGNGQTPDELDRTKWVIPIEYIPQSYIYPKVHIQMFLVSSDGSIWDGIRIHISFLDIGVYSLRRFVNSFTQIDHTQTPNLAKIHVELLRALYRME